MRAAILFTNSKRDVMRKFTIILAFIKVMWVDRKCKRGPTESMSSLRRCVLKDSDSFAPLPPSFLPQMPTRKPGWIGARSVNIGITVILLYYVFAKKN